MLEFDWDPVKAEANRKKHRVAFPEAATVFGDRLSVTFPDLDRVHNEARFVMIGVSEKGHTLVVVHAERGNVIRIISARRATRHERKFYEEKP